MNKTDKPVFRQEAADRIEDAQRENKNMNTQDKTQTDRMREIQSVTDAIDEVKRLVNWLEYIRENEFSESEVKRLIKTSLQFINTAQPIASKYID